VNKADNLPPSCAVVTKSGNLDFLEPSGPLQAYNGTALPLPLLSILKYSIKDAAVQISSIEKVTNYQFQTENLPAFRLSVRWLDYSSGKRKENS